ncbi:unnamed protein product [Mytilus edulis]|uniref:C-terminal of Roc (COR) domain-containing protein n=1 Tax=Mytilus edulis TaxID=6550 RepID=A0A8S3UVF8_MYTED|nr:unnamed protein product [Mytilus edulis]
MKEEGYYHYEARIMLAGEQGTGKTTIARYLIGKGSTRIRVSTDGIELYNGLSFIDRETEEWMHGKQDFTLSDIAISRSLRQSEDTSIFLKDKDKTSEKDSWSEDEEENSADESFMYFMNVDDPLHEQNKQMQNENSWNVNDVDNPFTDGRKAEPKYTPNDSFPSLSEQSTKEGLRNEIKELTSLEVHRKTSTDILQENITPSVNPLVHTKDKLKLFQSVLDGSRNLDDPCPFEQYLPGKSGHKTARDYLKFWINTIVTYCKGNAPGFPKILIVLTHKDKVKAVEVEQRRQQIFNDIENMFSGSPLLFHLVIKDRIFVNARNKRDPEMTTIKKAITEQVMEQPTWGQKLPKCFIPLELEFDSLLNRIEPKRYDKLHKRISAEFYYIPSMVRSKDTTGYLDSPTFGHRNIAIAFSPSSSMIPPALSFRFCQLLPESAIFTIDQSLDMCVNCDDEMIVVRLVHSRNRTLIMRDLASSIRECLAVALGKISQLYVKTSSIVASTVTDEEFLKQIPEDIHLLRLSMQFSVNETKELANHLGMQYNTWERLYLTFVEEPERLNFETLRKCLDGSHITFNDIRKAVESGSIQNPHIICKVNHEPEKWDMETTEEHFDRLAPLVGNNSLAFLVELGMEFQTWEQIRFKQSDRDLVKLNRDILQEWKTICNINTIRPSLRHIGQAFNNIGKNIKIVEHLLADFF